MIQTIEVLVLTGEQKKSWLQQTERDRLNDRLANSGFKIFSGNDHSAVIRPILELNGSRLNIIIAKSPYSVYDAGKSYELSEFVRLVLGQEGNDLSHIFLVGYCSGAQEENRLHFDRLVREATMLEQYIEEELMKDYKRFQEK